MKSKNRPLWIQMQLELEESNEAILERMRIAKIYREKDNVEHIICSINGFDLDKRELYEIPEVRAFCRRLVSLGFISYLDSHTTLQGATKDFEVVSMSLGAFEIWKIVENRINKDGEFNWEEYQEFFTALKQSNAVADSKIGAFKNPY